MHRKKSDASKVPITRNKCNSLENASTSRSNKQSLSTKQTLIKRKREELIVSASNSRTRPTAHSTIRDIESIVVCDRGTQCNRDLERVDSVVSTQILGSLIKDLRGLIKDERSEQTIKNVERLLYKAFPGDLGKFLSNNMEAMVLQSQLKTITTDLETTSRKLQETNATLYKEKESLNLQVQKQNIRLREAQQKEEEHRCTIKRLQNEIKDAEKLTKSHEKIILQLKRDKEKYQVLSIYKDKLLDELRSAMKELQNNAMEQFASLKDTYKTEEDRERVLFVDNELTWLSTSPTSFNDSMNSLSSKDESNTFSTHFANNSRNKDCAFIEYSANDEAIRVNNIDPELISLPNDVPPMSHTSAVFTYK